jgi:starch phosphorylase
VCWSWDEDSVQLFREIDPVRWRELDHNPIALLREMSMGRLEERARQLALHSRINHAFRRLREYLGSRKTWGMRHAGVLWARPVAYFSAEFGIHESLPIYSGGLGILAGDHLKSASDLGIPLVGIGLFYDQGYFKQRLDASGRQQEDYIDVNVALLPIEKAVGPDGQPIVIRIDTRSGAIVARVWKVAVGRNTLLLLDSTCRAIAKGRELTACLMAATAGSASARAPARRRRRPRVAGDGHAAGAHLNEGHALPCSSWSPAHAD